MAQYSPNLSRWLASGGGEGEVMTPETCNTCGENHTEFREGHCINCWVERQGALDLYNSAFDRWGSMSDSERDNAIKEASR